MMELGLDYLPQTLYRRDIVELHKDYIMETQMKKSEILRYAADELRGQTVYYVCHAIRAVIDCDNPIRHKTDANYRELIKMVSDSLDGESTVMVWLSIYKNQWYRENICTGKVHIQDYRIAWCLQMAEMYESRGE